VVFLRKSLHQGIDNPEVIEKRLGLSVYACIPHSKLQKQLYEVMHASKGTREANSLLALSDSSDLAIESLRSLRTNLHFGLMDAKNNIVMLTGPAPDIGKSFVSANFCQVLADSGQRVLLIDADLRKGHLHEYIGGHRESGLSDVIGGKITLADAVQKKEISDIGFGLLSTGALPPNPAELLMNARFGELLKEASEQYDLVLVDTPPVLAATDAVIIGKHAGTTFLLLRAGHHPLREIQQTLRHLEHGGIEPNGAIFNDMPERQGYGSYHYQYAYKSDQK
jgi:tyrosine-protein kinase Etk/Wzc